MEKLAFVLLVNVALGLAAYLKRSVTPGGCAAGIVLGSAILYFGGMFMWMVLVAFFISSSLLSFYKKNIKKDYEQFMEKNERRDMVQVMANGLPGGLFAVLYGLTGNVLFLVGFVVAFAASNADTWASEIGMLSKNEPVSIITLRPVPRGRSGGVSLLGILASMGGASFIGMVFVVSYSLLEGYHHMLFNIAMLATLGGTIGSLVDSILGATLQAQYYCTVTDSYTEKRIKEGRPTRLVRGYQVVNNDMVNFLSSLSAVFLMVILYQPWMLLPV